VLFAESPLFKLARLFACAQGERYKPTLQGYCTLADLCLCHGAGVLEGTAISTRLPAALAALCGTLRFGRDGNIAGIKT